jgi:D-inositol-3-phosphate glycosyltransferase
VATFHTLARTKEQALAAEEPPPRAHVEGEVVREAARVIATTPHEKESLVRLYSALPDRVEVAPCGVDLDLFKPVERTEARRSLGIAGEKVVLFVGRLERIKGVELLLRTAAIMDGGDNVRVLIVGGEQGSGGEAERLKALARELGIQERVWFTGRVEQTALPTYYSAADVCVVPSYYESFGLAALEAMACGTPVVAARVGGLPWVVQHNRTGYLVPWHCPEPFANWLETLLSSEDLRRRMGAAAYQFAQSMGWEQVSARVLDIYSTLATPGKVEAAVS